MKVKPEDLSKGIYQNLNVDALNLPIEAFYYRDRDQESIGFNTGAIDAVSKFFCDTVQLKNPDIFKKKLEQSISGDGGELTKNDALHSSSLCALLMFYNVNEDNPFSIEFPNGSIHSYTEVFFEVKNKVITKPSNMDVVLINKVTDEILFIESKFSEYLKHQPHYKLRKGYEENYPEYFDAINIRDMEIFPDGIKQLVAHYIGIGHFKKCNYTKEDLDSFYFEDDARRELYNKQYSNIAFMEVIFKLPYPEFDEYKKETEKTFKYLDKKKKITILYTKTYQELFKGKNKDILSPLVISYYGLE